jgi:2-polyprenyl-3-methyl-5-hydroxy-6-metoxy-1,4-benzoquinol methylase
MVNLNNKIFNESKKLSNRAKISDYYSNKIEYDPNKTRINNILELMGDIKGKKILDLGCGNGKMGKKFKERGARVYGCEISEKITATARQNLDEAFVFDVEKDDFNLLDKDYDFIVASEIIEHLFLPEEFLLNLKKIISKNCRVIITTPNFLVWTNRIRMLFGQFAYTERGFIDESHIHFFSYNSLRKLIKKTGFIIEREENIIHPRIPVWFGRLMPNLFSYQVIVKLKSA